MGAQGLNIVKDEGSWGQKSELGLGHKHLEGGNLRVRKRYWCSELRDRGTQR